MCKKKLPLKSVMDHRCCKIATTGNLFATDVKTDGFALFDQAFFSFYKKQL